MSSSTGARGREDWARIANEDEVPSPALLIYPERLQENLRRMLAIAGDPGRLRPHVKTHKLGPVVAMQIALGIVKFKAATIAEAEMCALAGAPDVLLAYQPVGPNLRRFVRLARAFPGTRWSTIADDPGVIRALGTEAAAAGIVVEVFLDLNVGMNRTGAFPTGGLELYRAIVRTAGLRARGFHAYDGHLHDRDPSRLADAVRAAFQPIWKLRDQVLAAGMDVPTIVAGGTPTLPALSQVPGLELGSGTSVLWDGEDAERCPYLDFLHAAALLTRVVSRPASNRLCFDLGHKAVASEMPPPRVRLLGLDDAAWVMHSEEHLVAETARAGDYGIGQPLYGIPRHVCPTVALHDKVHVVRNGRAAEIWEVAARARAITF